MNDLLKQKSSFIALALYAIGIFLHVRGRDLSGDQTAVLQQMLGLLFDTVASLIPYFSSLHKTNAQNIQDNRTVLNRTSTAGDLPPIPGTQAISPVAAQSVNSAAPPLVKAPVQPTPKP